MNRTDFWLHFFLLVYGLDARKGNENNRKRLRKLPVFICAIICHGSFMFSILSWILYADELFKPDTLKRSIAIKFKAMNNILLWYSLYFKRSEIREMIEEMHILGKELRVALPLRISKMFVTWLAADFSLGVLVYSYSGARNLFYKKYFTLGYYDPSKSSTMFCYYVSLMMYSSAQSFMTSVCCFYTCLCYFLYKMLRKIAFTTSGVSKPESAVDKKTTTMCVHYDKIINALRNLENAMSRTVFILLVTMFLNIFASLHTFVINEPQNDIFGTPLSARHWYMFFQSMLNFLIICYFTILINETDKKMKITLKNFIKKGLFTNRNSLEVLRVNANDSAFTLSAWGFFHFTKSFLVAAFGGAFTYYMVLLGKF